MNTTDLPAQIRECVSQGASPVTLDEVKARAAPPERAVRRVLLPMPRRTRLGVAVTGVVAAGIAGALVASQSGGTAVTGAVLTSATLKHIASASQTAMTSGQASLVTTTGGSTLVQQITFDGANWNDVTDPGAPLKIHQSAHMISWTGESIDRVVDGQAYHYPTVVFKPTPHPIQAWMHITAPGAGTSLNIPDPRTLLSTLSSSAGFVTDGYATVTGVRVEHLRATTPAAVPLQPLNPLIGTEPDIPHLSALDLWVDSSDVVLKAQFTVSGTDTVSTLTAAGTQALRQYIKEHGLKTNAVILHNGGALSAWAQSQAAAGNTGVAALLRQPGMVTTGHVKDSGVTVTVTFSQIGQPQTITVPTDIVSTSGTQG